MVDKTLTSQAAAVTSEEVSGEKAGRNAALTWNISYTGMYYYKSDQLSCVIYSKPDFSTCIEGWSDSLLEI